MTHTSPLDRIAALRAARTAATKLVPNPPDLANETHFAADLAERLAAGEDVRPMLDQWAAHRRAAADHAALRSVVATAVDHLGDLLRQAERDAAPHRLAALADELGELVTDARAALRKLGTARTAEAAIRVGAADAWQRITDLGGRYAALRTRQANLTGELMGDSYAATTRVKRVGILANLRDVWPDAVKWDANEQCQPAPWPHEQGRPYDTPHGRDFLIWLAETPDARPWVPSVEQLDQADAAAREALNAHHLAKRGNSSTDDNHTHPMRRTA